MLSYARSTADPAGAARGLRAGAFAMIPRLGLVGVAVLLGASAALADPAGFTDIPWGATRATINEKLVKDKCGWSVNVQKIDEDTIVCYDYPLEGIGRVVLNLDFVDGAFHGYTIMVPSQRLGDFRSWVRQRLGEPTHTSQYTGEVASWQWPSGASAVFRQHCLRPTEACLSLDGPAPPRAPYRPREQSSRQLP